MSEQVTTQAESKKSKAISITRIIIVLGLIIFASGTFFFGYLYLSTDTSVVVDNEEIDVEEIELTEEPEEVETRSYVCDLDELISDQSNNDERISFALSHIFNVPEENGIYSNCRNDVKDRIVEILGEDFHKDQWYRGNNVAYLIDSTFLVYGIQSIWAVDIENETSERFWHTDEYLMVHRMFGFPGRDSNTIFFSVTTYGLGGTEEDAEMIDNFINKMCLKELLGVWQYDTVSEEFIRITVSEDCK